MRALDRDLLMEWIDWCDPDRGSLFYDIERSAGSRLQGHGCRDPWQHRADVTVEAIYYVLQTRVERADEATIYPLPPPDGFPFDVTASDYRDIRNAIIGKLQLAIVDHIRDELGHGDQPAPRDLSLDDPDLPIGSEPVDPSVEPEIEQSVFERHGSELASGISDIIRPLAAWVRACAPTDAGPVMGAHLVDVLWRLQHLALGWLHVEVLGRPSVVDAIGQVASGQTWAQWELWLDDHMEETLDSLTPFLLRSVAAPGEERVEEWHRVSWTREQALRGSRGGDTSEAAEAKYRRGVAKRFRNEWSHFFWRAFLQAYLDSYLERFRHVSLPTRWAAWHRELRGDDVARFGFLANIGGMLEQEREWSGIPREDGTYAAGWTVKPPPSADAMAGEDPSYRSLMATGRQMLWSEVVYDSGANGAWVVTPLAAYDWED